MEEPETAKRLAQRIKAVLDVAKSKGFRDGENPVTTIRDARVLPQVKQKVQQHKAMRWKDVATFYADLATKDAMAAKALMFNRSDSAGKIKRPKPERAKAIRHGGKF